MNKTELMDIETLDDDERLRLEEIESEDNKTLARLDAIHHALSQVIEDDPEDEDSFEKLLLKDVELAIIEARELAGANDAKGLLLGDVSRILSPPPGGLRDWCRELISRLSQAGAAD